MKYIDEFRNSAVAKKLIEQMESERKLWDAEAIRQIIHTHLNESEIL